MKVARLVGKKNICIEDVDIPSPKGNEVLVRVGACGICGSDIPRYYLGRVHFFPIVLGHEISGIVSECGGSVRNVSNGDHVVIVPLIPCGQCDSCKVGNFSLCSNYRFIGSSVDGGFAEYMVVPASNVYKVAKDISHSDAVFFETATVALHAVDLLGNVSNKKVAVVGTGTVGLLCAQWLRIYNASVSVFGRSPDNERVAKLDLPYFSLHDLNDSYDSKFDFVIDAVGSSSSINTSISFLSRKGTLSLVGTPNEDVIFTSKAWTFINRKEIIIKGSWMGYSTPYPGSEWSRVSEAMEKGQLKLGEVLLYDQKFPLEKINDAFALYEKGVKVRGRVLVCPVGE